MHDEEEHAVALVNPVEPDPVLSPRVVVDGSVIQVHYLTAVESGEADRYGRATAEGPDAIRVCRGEFFPFPSESFFHSSLAVVRNSRWQIERYEYEAAHYRDAFEFGNDVDSMLTEYAHYVLSFHDEFVEIIARGICFEESDREFNRDDTPIAFRDLALSENRNEVHRASFRGSASISTAMSSVGWPASCRAGRPVAGSRIGWARR